MNSMLISSCILLRTIHVINLKKIFIKKTSENFKHININEQTIMCILTQCVINYHDLFRVLYVFVCRSSNVICLHSAFCFDNRIILNTQTAYIIFSLNQSNLNTHTMLSSVCKPVNYR